MKSIVRLLGRQFWLGLRAVGMALIALTAAHAAPSSVSISANTYSITTNQSVTFTVSATDSDSDLRAINLDIVSPANGYFKIDAGPYTYSGGSPPNNGFKSFADTSSNSHSCTITFTQAGTYQFRGAASDPYGWYYSGNITITVSAPANSPPSVSISANTYSIGINQAVTFTVSASDSDANMDALNLDIISPQNGYFKIDAGPYTYSGSPPNNGYKSFWPTSSNSHSCTITFTQTGTYYFRGAARDSAGWSYSGSIAITVANRAPSSSLSASATTIALGQYVDLTSTVTDPDGNLYAQAVDRSTDNANWTSGWNNWSGQTAWYVSGSSATNTIRYTPPAEGTYYFRSRGQDAMGALSDLVYVNVAVRAVTFDWGDTPTSAASGSTYHVMLNVGNTGGMPYVYLYKNGAYFSGGWFGTQGYTSDTGAQTVNYLGTYSDSSSGLSGSTSRAVQIYNPNYTLTTSVSPSGAGSVSLDPAGGSYQAGTVVSATASANSGYSFTNWSGAATGSGTSVSVTMDANKSIAANFIGIPLASAASGIGSAGFTANWSSAPNASSYRLDVSTSSGFSSYVSGYQDLNVGSATSYAVSGLSASTTYYYRVRAANANGTSANSGTITVTTSAAAPPPPTITSATEASGTVNTAFSYQITGTNSPTSYGASNLPAGLTVNTATGVISGTPTATGTTSTTITATNAGGSGSATLTITINTSQPINLMIHRPQ